MNVAVGGVSGYWPDSTPNKPWKDNSGQAALDFWRAKNNWYKTWPSDEKRALAVDSVKMWRQC
jgi:hypothetical protein